MKYFLVSLSLMLLSFNSFAQHGYQKGLIVTMANDTIMCEVPITSSFGTKVTILKDSGKTETTIPLNDIKFLANAFNVFEHITFIKNGKEKHSLMQILAYGKINLYMEYIYNYGAPRKGSGKLGNMTFTPGSTPTVTYVLRKNDRNFLVEKEKFIEMIKPLISEVPELVAKVEGKTLTYEKLEEIISQYNSQF